MHSLPRIALFGVTPLSLLLGRACCLADNSPVGLFEPDSKLALQGALILGIAARKKPEDMAPVEVAILARPEAWPDTPSTLEQKSPLLLCLFDDPVLAPNWHNCQLLLQTPLASQELAVAESIPPLSFQLQGTGEAIEKGRRFLASLSSSFTYT